MGEEETARDRLELEKEQEEREEVRNGEGSEREFISAFLCLNPPLHGDCGLSFLQFQKRLQLALYQGLGSRVY